MRRIVLGVLLIIWSGSGFSQNMDNWQAFIDAEVKSREHINAGVFLVEATKDELNSFSSLTILRSFDRLHHIVKGTAIVKGRTWLVKDEWKLDVSGDDDVSLFYIVTTSDFNADLLNPFEIVRSYESTRTYLIRGKLKDIKHLLLSEPDVIHITDKVGRPKVESRVIDLNLNPNRVNKIHHFYPELDGSSELISIQENKFREEDIDLINRSIMSGLESELVDNHATEMATIIAGAGNSFITGKGVAIDASITSSDFVDAMPDADQSYLDLGINTQNHSYGIDRTSEYGVQARAFDMSASNNTNLLHVFSSGNAGLEVSQDGLYEGIEGYANLSGNINMATNILVVGSVDTVGNIPAFVSRGPAYDGRIKPEVVSYSVVGSSNSAALVSGVSALLQQQYRMDHSGQDMPSALLKALLINGAEDVGPLGLDFLTGYGNVNAWKSLQSLRNLQFVSGTVSNGLTNEHVINLPAEAKNLKVTLVWTDPAANIGDFKALVNDLDLRLDDGTTETLPWILDPSPNTSALSSAAVRGIDTLNNVEQVTIKNPGISYTIEVEASSSMSDQEYYVTWQYDLDDWFEWDYPTGSDNMPYNGETGSYFRWSTTKEGTGELSYTVDGDNWVILDDDIDLSVGYWRWNNPPEINNAVKARMITGGEIFETDTFTVSVPLKATVGFNCADSLMIKWDYMNNATNYIISYLGDENLEELTNTSDTFLIISQASLIGDTQIAVQPELSDGKQLLRTPTFDFTRQGVECYVSSFFQTVALDTGIYLNLSLGTFYGIESISFERNNFNGYIPLTQIDDVSSDEILYLDANPIQGYNEHRAIIRFINGEEITLYSGSVYYLTEIPIKIFPNPVRVGEPFVIITKPFEDRTPIIEIIDQEGSLIHRQEVLGSLDNIQTDMFKSGIYYYRLFADGDVYTGRLLVR